MGKIRPQNPAPKDFYENETTKELELAHILSPEDTHFSFGAAAELKLLGFTMYLIEHNGRQESKVIRKVLINFSK